MVTLDLDLEFEDVLAFVRKIVPQLSGEERWRLLRELVKDEDDPDGTDDDSGVSGGKPRRRQSEGPGRPSARSAAARVDPVRPRSQASAETLPPEARRRTPSASPHSSAASGVDEPDGGGRGGRREPPSFKMAEGSGGPETTLRNGQWTPAGPDEPAPSTSPSPPAFVESRQPAASSPSVSSPTADPFQAPAFPGAAPSFEAAPPASQPEADPEPFAAPSFAAGSRAAAPVEPTAAPAFESAWSPPSSQQSTPSWPGSSSPSIGAWPPAATSDPFLMAPPSSSAPEKSAAWPTESASPEALWPGSSPSPWSPPGVPEPPPAEVTDQSSGAMFALPDAPEPAQTPASNPFGVAANPFEAAAPQGGAPYEPFGLPKDRFGSSGALFPDMAGGAPPDLGALVRPSNPFGPTGTVAEAFTPTAAAVPRDTWEQRLHDLFEPARNDGARIDAGQLDEIVRVAIQESRAA